MLSGLAISSLFVILNLTDFASVILLAGVIGIYFGLGMPTFAGFFAASTESKNRAKFGGLIILLIVLGYPNCHLDRTFINLPYDRHTGDMVNIRTCLLDLL